MLLGLAAAAGLRLSDVRLKQVVLRTEGLDVLKNVSGVFTVVGGRVDSMDGMRWHDAVFSRVCCGILTVIVRGNVLQWQGCLLRRVDC